jgi:hypothetical protein
MTTKSQRNANEVVVRVSFRLTPPVGASTLVEQPHSGETGPLNSCAEFQEWMSRSADGRDQHGDRHLPKLTPWVMNVVGQAINTGTTPSANLLYPWDPPKPTNSIPQCRAPRKDKMIAP